MNPEPLDLGMPFAVELERLLLDKYGWEVDYGAILIIFDEIKQRIKQACEFYLRFVDNPGLLIEEYPEFKEKVEKMKLLPNPDFFYEEYNEWLFKLAFKDVLEEVK